MEYEKYRDSCSATVMRAVSAMTPWRDTLQTLILDQQWDEEEEEDVDACRWLADFTKLQDLMVALRGVVPYERESIEDVNEWSLRVSFLN